MHSPPRAPWPRIAGRRVAPLGRRSLPQGFCHPRRRSAGTPRTARFLLYHVTITRVLLNERMRLTVFLFH